VKITSPFGRVNLPQTENLINMKRTKEEGIIDLVLDEDVSGEHDLYYLEWEDAIAHSGWMSEKEATTWFEKQTMTVKQVGWIVKETAKYIAVISRISDWGEGESEWGLMQKIPRTWIRKRILLTNFI